MTLLEAEIQNFKSFRAPAAVSLVSSAKSKKGKKGKGAKTLPVALFLGANGSGKSNFFAALRFLIESVNEGFLKPSRSFSMWKAAGVLPSSGSGLGTPRNPFLPTARRSLAVRSARNC